MTQQERRRATQFQRAAEGSMSLMEHLRELRTRLFRASLGIVVGFAIGFWAAGRVLEFIQIPYCHTFPPGECKTLIQLGPADALLLTLKVALWVGLILSSPMWLYQLWAFIAPGLHRRERRWAYIFAAVAAPLFALGALLASYVVEKGLKFLLMFNPSPNDVQLELVRYVDFVVSLVVIFGVAFEFPLVLLMLNFSGMVTGRALLAKWRVAVFLFFAFAAIVTPTPDPFGMTAFALSLSLLFFGAVGIALFNDRRRARRAPFAGLSDDEASPLEERIEPVEPPRPLDDDRYDDTT